METIVVLDQLNEIKNVLGEEKYKELMERAIEQHTFNKTLGVYWDYRDENEFEDVVASKLAEMDFNEVSENSFEDNKNKLLDDFYEGDDWDWQSDIDYLENEIRKKFVSLAENELEGKYEVDPEWSWFSEELYNTFDCKTDDGIKKHLESAEVNINLMLQYKDEWNSDFSNIESMNACLTGYTNGYSCATILEDGVTEDDHYRFENNALSWLIYQQGYTMEDLVSGKNSPFLNSVRQELANMTNYMNVLTVLLKTDAMDALQMMSSDCQNIKISNDVNSIGIFSPWAGGGSLLEIELEKDIVLPKEMIRGLQFEGIKTHGEYTVDEVYGLVNDCWAKDCLSFTDESAMNEFEIDYNKVCLELWKQGKLLSMEDVEELTESDILDSVLNIDLNGSLTVKQAFEYLGIEEVNYKEYLNNVDFLIELEKMDEEALENGLAYGFSGDKSYLGLNSDDVVNETENFIQFRGDNQYGNFKKLDAVIDEVNQIKEKSCLNDERNIDTHKELDRE